MLTRAGTPTPWSYFLIRILFKFVLKIFYGSIVVENVDVIPKTGVPCIVCANHSNSLTDALLLVTSIPPSRRNMLRLTAKSTQFGKKTFTSWLIENAGTVPIHRRKDFGDGPVDNSENMLQLIKALETGDAVCLFPEGMSRYHPTIAPLKTGVARLVSDVLSRNRNEPDFEITLLSCSITYMHRQHWRSDVLITFHEPATFRPKDNPELLEPVSYDAIRGVTTQLYKQISSGTIDSPSWDLVRISKLAARIYAPLGTRMSLGDHVRAVRSFLEAFKLLEQDEDETGPAFDKNQLAQLSSGLKMYQNEISRCGLKDDRIRKPLPRHVIIYRMIIRLAWSGFLLFISIPGLCLWFPVFATTNYFVRSHKRSGPVFDTWDEITQHKLLTGLASGLAVWLSVVLLTLPIAFLTSIFVPACMWMTLRWIEDGVASFRAFVALYRLLRLGKSNFWKLQEQRTQLQNQVMTLATTLDLPPDPENYFAEAGGREKGRVRGTWDSRARYFSIKRRRKRDWNETLRLYDKVDYPEDDTLRG
ncbi:hypothetical protein K435DRAFT_666471 [Dendrothele bispora CBS 962.96]|uniref:Phospholipid/glycerol acyltransferase domain-containing protein n=1 Tax=Dendrothele bispora (strain CBS 962.96) TaxID=1314807 RepID=A0A4S8M038_DENBC|nr:hypothetical protein K435DRAFT_666471 [Dendrothele bispora CBS 962.96]